MRRVLVSSGLVLWSLLMVIATTAWPIFQRTGVDATAGILVAALCSVLVGAVLSIKVPSNSVGPLALIAGSAGVVYFFGNQYAVASLDQEAGVRGAYFLGWMGSWVGALFPIGVSLLIFVFPTGRPVGWWRMLVAGPIIGALSSLLGAALLWGLPLTTLISTDLLSQTRAYGFVDAGFILGFMSAIPATLSVIARFRRAAFVERQQIKWLLAATCAFAVAYIIGATSEDEWVWWVVSLAMAAIPLAILLAVLRYRLYEIDRIISRTVAYVIVIALLGVVYVGGAAALTSFLPDESPLTVAGSTLAAAAAFNPVRRRVQDWVDRRFNRSRYDAEKVMQGFAGSLRGQVDSEGLVDGWVTVVSETMEPASVAVWVREEPTPS
jgi:hypothetical protein